jgi:hypothetical protein
MFDNLKILTNVVSANAFDEVGVLELLQDSYPFSFRIMLWQDDKGQRYIPAVGSTAIVEFLRMETVAETPAVQTVTKALAQTYVDDGSIWGCELVEADLDNVVSAGFRVTLTEGAAVSVVYAKMTIRKLQSSS